MGRREREERPEGLRFRQELRYERERRGWSQEHVAKLLAAKGFGQVYATTIAKIEAGDRAVTIAEAAAIAGLFGVSLDVMLGRSVELATDVTYLVDGLRDAARRAEDHLNAILTELGEKNDVLSAFEFDGCANLRSHLEQAVGPLRAARFALRNIDQFELPDEFEAAVMIDAALAQKLSHRGFLREVRDET